MSRITMLVASAAFAVVAGCTPDTERAAVGAGVGAVGAAVFDGNILAGAAVGAAAGALCDDVRICR